MKQEQPTHGYCSVCGGAIPKGVQWTLTSILQRVHSDPDDCIAVLHPKLYKKFIKANPTYGSRRRY